MRNRIYALRFALAVGRCMVAASLVAVLFSFCKEPEPEPLLGSWRNAIDTTEKGYSFYSDGKLWRFVDPCSFEGLERGFCFVRVCDTVRIYSLDCLTGKHSGADCCGCCLEEPLEEWQVLLIDQNHLQVKKLQSNPIEICFYLRTYWGEH